MNSIFRIPPFCILLLFFPIMSNSQELDYNAIDEYVSSTVELLDQPGLAVGIVLGGELVWTGGYGKLDLDRKAKVDDESIFFLASISKGFTACAIGLLVDEQVLSWDDPVVDHMPWFKTPDPWVTQHSTVKDLLCHRSGWITFDGDLLWYGSNYDQKEILSRHSAEPTSYGFRNGYGYSNLMFIAAAQLIEEVSGKTWDEFITEHIILPLGMGRTTVQTDVLAEMKNVALPHVRKGQNPAAPQKSMAYQSLEGADGATGINSCVVDLAKWDAMWANEGMVGADTFLKPETWLTITTPHNSFPVSPSRASSGRHFNGAALGWFTEDYKGVKILKHSGGMPGFILNHAVVPEKDLAVIALGNGESYSVFAVTNKILDLCLGKNDSDPTASILAYTKTKRKKDSIRVAERVAKRNTDTQPSVEKETLVGKYKDKIYGTAVIADLEGSLQLTFEPARNLFTGPLSHWHYDTWKWDHDDPFLEPGYVTFYFDANHKPKGFKIELHSPDFHFYKLDFVKE